jgi:hypothetical protein
VSQVTVDVIADPAVGPGGHARIRLKGLWLLPPASTFRIEQLDQDGTIEPDWPGGDHSPRDVEVTGEGIELHVGPDIVDSPALQPGTPVRILVPNADIAAEIRWPSLPPSVAPRGPAVVMSAAQRAAETEAALKLKLEMEQRAADEALERQREADATIEAMRVAKLEAEKRAADALAEQRRTDDAADAVRRVADVGRRRGSPSVDGPLARPFPNGAYLNGHSNVLETLQPETFQPKSGLNTVLTRNPGTVAQANHDSAAAVTAGRLATLSRTRVRAPMTSTEYPAPRNSALAIPVGSQVRKATESKSASALPILTFCVGLLFPLALAAVGWALWGGSLNLQIVPPPAASTSRAKVDGSTLPAVQITEPSVGVGLTSPPATSYVSVEDIFTIGAISPRGQSATNMTADAARALADRSLHGVGQPVDREEARFWLRKSLTVQLGNQQTMWAMTQLGTLYAAPEQGAPDFGKARALWEIASAAGDPVAGCFLSSLHELGLGVSANRQSALGYAVKAKAQGGCQDIDVTLARLK